MATITLGSVAVGCGSLSHNTLTGHIHVHVHANYTQVNEEREYRDCRRDKIRITRHTMMHQVLYI